MVDITFVRSAIYDARVVRVIRSLSKKYSAIYLFWNREGIDDGLREEMLKKAFDSNLHLSFRVLDVKAPHGERRLRSYVPLLFFLPIFWSWVFVNLVIHRPKIVHAFDFDTFLPCFIYKMLFRRKLIFEIVDRYAMTFIPKKFYSLYWIINSLEEAYCKRSDVLITLSENVLKSFRNKPPKSAVILNCPEDYANKRIKTEEGPLVLGYSGAINKGRGLEQIAAALTDLSNVKLYIYGPVIDEELLNKITQLPNIEYKGYLRMYDDYHKAIISTDAIIAVYTVETPSHSITMHNKTLEAMMGGIPIITNLSPELVQEIEFGIVVEYGNIEQIRSAIIVLRDDAEIRKRLGDNGRKAFLQKYNWSIMEQKLYDVYENLI